jgi:hypothetical protein
LWIGSEAVRGDGVRHRLHPLHWPTVQDFPSSPGPQGGVVSARRCSIPAANVVEQRRRSDDRQVSSLGSRDALGQPQHAQDVIEVVYGVRTRVETPRLGDRYHARCNCFLSS